MTEKLTVSTLDTNQAGTGNLESGPTLTPQEAPQTPTASPPVDPLYPPEGPNPQGTQPGVVEKMEKETAEKGTEGRGVEGESNVWEARYSMKNFLGRMLVRTLLTIGWIILAVYTWGYDHSGVTFFTVLAGVILVAFWVMLLYRILLARYGHEYLLTNRRLFVTTGLLRRRRDQMELLRVKDVFTRQTMTDNWLSIGTVVVVPDESSLPTFYLAGVDDPQRVMDLVWHCARSERDGKTVQVENL